MSFRPSQIIHLYNSELHSDGVSQWQSRSFICFQLQKRTLYMLTTHPKGHIAPEYLSFQYIGNVYMSVKEVKYCNLFNISTYI
jgi:hypothetical protein